MGRFTVRGNARLVRVLRGLWPDRNPLRRGIDRAEAGIVALLLVVFMIGAPLAAITAGRAAQGAASGTQATQAVWRQVPAVLLAGPRASAYPLTQPRKARWTAPDGMSRTGEVLASVQARAGTTVMVWVDHSGRLTGPPLLRSQVAGWALSAEIFAPLVLALALLAAGALAHGALDQRRLAAWGTEWRSTGPRWTRHR